jgi:hypothetical protein
MKLLVPVWSRSLYFAMDLLYGDFTGRPQTLIKPGLERKFQPFTYFIEEIRFLMLESISR